MLRLVSFHNSTTKSHAYSLVNGKASPATLSNWVVSLLRAREMKNNLEARFVAFFVLLCGLRVVVAAAAEAVAAVISVANS